MSKPRESIVRDAMELPERDRARIIQDLLGSLSPDSSELLDDVWDEELDRRFAAWQQNPSTAVAWSELKTQR